jgi:hypothetical protein
MRSHRWTATAGIFLMGVGSILSAFANSPVDLYLTVGLVIGNNLFKVCTGGGLNQGPVANLIYFLRP